MTWFLALHELCDGYGPTELNGKMDVIGDAANARACTAKVTAYCCEISVEIGTNRGRQAGDAVFGAEDEVKQNAVE